LLVGELSSHVESAVRESGLQDIVRPTGYVGGKAFEDYCAIADICVNLRYPTLGETSASVCRLMGAAKACVVSDIGWFSELPDDCVAKVGVDEFEEQTLLGYLERLIASEALRATMGTNARDYIRANHSIRTAASQYVEFLREVNEHSQKRRFDRTLIEGIAAHMAYLGITDEDHLIERPAAILARLL
jgi:glycosyltransferase involved in cell wall biosynthesis